LRTAARNTGKIMDRISHRHKLAAEAVAATLTLVARHSASSGTMEIIELNRRLGDLQEGDGGALRRTLQSLHNLAGAPALMALRLVTAALAQSLPRICETRVTAQDLRLAALDLRRLEKEALLLRAPDVAAVLVAIIVAILAQTGPASSPGKAQLH